MTKSTVHFYPLKISLLTTQTILRPTARLHSSKSIIHRSQSEKIRIRTHSSGMTMKTVRARMVAKRTRSRQKITVLYQSVIIMPWYSLRTYLAGAQIMLKMPNHPFRNVVAGTKLVTLILTRNVKINLMHRQQVYNLHLIMACSREIGSFQVKLHQ